MLDILVVAHFTGPAHDSNSRFRELARILSERGATVELVTSSFLHEAKTQRDNDNLEEGALRFTHIKEPGYPSNISIKRLFSHRVMARNLGSYLKGRKVPDVIYCAMPSNAVASVVTRYAKRRGVRLILDVQDLWPEAFEMVLRPKRVARFILSPLRLNADRLFRAADHVVTVSETYSNRVRKVREKDVSTTFLGTNLELFDQHPPLPWNISDRYIHLAYIGTLGHSYNLPLVFDAIRLLKKENLNLVFHLMGTGPLEDEWKTATKDLHEIVFFHGRLSYSEMVSRLRACDIAINPIVPGSAGSIINKVCDYAAAGLPVVNTQESSEYRVMLHEFQAGINCASEPHEVASALRKLAKNAELRVKLGEGSRRLAEANFDRNVTYESLANLALR